MAFIETEFPLDISRGAKGGPQFSTMLVQVGGGGEQTDRKWTYPLHRFDVAAAIKSREDMEAVQGIFWVAAGRANSFRFEDPADYKLAYTNATLGSAGVGDGTPGPHQIYKSYTFGANTAKRKISKPRASGFSVKRGGVLQTAGAGVGNYALDSTTGLVTFVADAGSNASSITVGATTQVVLAANPGTLTAGQKLYLVNFAGTHAALVNNLAHTINSVTGTGPYTFTLATNTSGKTITLGSGIGRKYAQASEALTCAGEFCVPVRFDSDYLPVADAGRDLATWDSIILVEKRL